MNLIAIAFKVLMNLFTPKVVHFYSLYFLVKKGMISSCSYVLRIYGNVMYMNDCIRNYVLFNCIITVLLSF